MRGTNCSQLLVLRLLWEQGEDKTWFVRAAEPHSPPFAST